MRDLRTRLWRWLNGRGQLEVIDQVKAKRNLVQAIQEYWIACADDPRHATRLERRRFARALADLIVEHINVKGD